MPFESNASQSHEKILGKHLFLGRKKGIRVVDLETAENGELERVVKGLDGKDLLIEFGSNKLSVKEKGGFEFIVTLDNGIVSFSVENSIGNKRSHNIFPAQLLTYVLGKWGERVKTVQGKWRISGGGTNTAQYYEARRKGKLPEDAALSTWTGKTLSRIGFGKVVKVDEENHWINAYFERTQSTSQT